MDHSLRKIIYVACLLGSPIAKYCFCMLVVYWSLHSWINVGHSLWCHHLFSFYDLLTFDNFLNFENFFSSTASSYYCAFKGGGVWYATTGVALQRSDTISSEKHFAAPEYFFFDGKALCHFRILKGFSTIECDLIINLIKNLLPPRSFIIAVNALVIEYRPPSC